MVSNKDDNYILQFISKDFKYLTSQTKIPYKGKNLKTAYLINIIHELLLKYYFSNNVDLKFNLSSLILKKKYGQHYNYYIQYLCDNGFMSLVSKYFRDYKTNSYKIVTKSVYDVIRWKNEDKILLKKQTDRYESSITEINEKSSINPFVREKLTKSIRNIKIDYFNAIQLIDKMKKKGEINDNQYHKNIISIEGINDDNIYFNFDDYGRFHSNFTILKKVIRNNYLTINNEMIGEIDIKNSQPLFFAVVLKQAISRINGDTKKYFDLVKSGLIYEDIINHNPTITRKQAKEIVYIVLFGKNKTIKANKAFKELYPSVYEYILEFKEMKNNYKELAYKLQKMESNFLFNTVVREIYETYPNITLFTVHDSILFPLSYKEKIEKIFNKHFEKLISKI